MPNAGLPAHTQLHTVCVCNCVCVCLSVCIHLEWLSAAWNLSYAAIMATPLCRCFEWHHWIVTSNSIAEKPFFISNAWSHFQIINWTRWDWNPGQKREERRAVEDFSVNTPVLHMEGARGLRDWLSESPIYYYWYETRSIFHSNGKKLKHHKKLSWSLVQ